MIVSVREVGVVEAEVAAVEVGVEEAQHPRVGGGGEGGAEPRVLRHLLLLLLLPLLLALLQPRRPEDVGRRRALHGRRGEGGGEARHQVGLGGGLRRLHLAGGGHLVLHVGQLLLPAVLLHLWGRRVSSLNQLQSFRGMMSERRTHP